MCVCLVIKLSINWCLRCKGNNKIDKTPNYFYIFCLGGGLHAGERTQRIALWASEAQPEVSYCSVPAALKDVSCLNLIFHKVPLRRVTCALRRTIHCIASCARNACVMTRRVGAFFLIPIVWLVKY